MATSPKSKRARQEEAPAPVELSEADLEAAIRVGRAVSASADLYESAELRELRKAWGPLVARKGKECYQKAGGSAYDARKSRIQKQREHDKRLLETRRLRAARKRQLDALQANPDSAMAAIPDGAVDDGVNTSYGQAGGTKDVPQVLAAPGQIADGAEGQGNGEEDLLHQPRSCYACKGRFFKMHHFYDQFCPTCATLNWDKRMQTTDMTGKVVLLTGGRVKIGFHIALKCLRMGATLHVTTRFVADAALRFSKEADFAKWRANLKIHGLDFRDIAAVERFCSHLSATLPRLDVIVNNACQTIRRPPLYYRHLMAMETKLLEGSVDTSGTHFQEARATIDQTRWHLPGGGVGAASSQLADAAATHGDDDDNDNNDNNDNNGGEDDGKAAAKDTGKDTGALTVGVAPMDVAVPAKKANKPLSAAEMSQVALGPLSKEEQDTKLFPEQVDVNGTQIDLRKETSWVLTLSKVSTPEVVEVLAVNTVAPLIFNARLKDLMARTRQQDLAAGAEDRGRYVINVSAMEGKFYRFKNANHPHTNMAKAALNMMTRTSSSEFAKEGIYMNSVDTGWINDENPLDKAAEISAKNNFQTPIDEVDAAARVLDPAVSGMNGAPRVHGKFLKDYRETEW